MVLSFPEYAHPYEAGPGFSRYANFAPSLGDLGQDTTTIAAIAAQGAATTGGLLSGLSAMGALAPEFALAGPIGAAIAGLTAVGIAIAGFFSGCGQTCVQAANDANTVQAYLDQNEQHYFGAPVHYRSMQLAAMNNVHTALTALQKACSDPALGAAGQRCISERLVQGGTAPWCPNPGGTGCDWVTAYLLPIQNDPSVVPDPPPLGQVDPNAPGTISVMNPDGSISVVSASSLPAPSGPLGIAVASSASKGPLLIGAALIVAAIVLGGGN
jgi:hypothetical protein